MESAGEQAKAQLVSAEAAGGGRRLTMEAYSRDWAQWAGASPDRAHHTNMDVYEALDGSTLARNAAIVAAFAYQAANDDARVPRKPLPSPSAPPTAGGAED